MLLRFHKMMGQVKSLTAGQWVPSHCPSYKAQTRLCAGLLTGGLLSRLANLYEAQGVSR